MRPNRNNDDEMAGPSLHSIPEPGGWQDEDQMNEDNYDDEYRYEEEGGYGNTATGGDRNRVSFDQPHMESTSTKKSILRRRSRQNHLSKVSKAYDTGGKGYLTPAEQQLREMDLNGEGNLSNAIVAQIMEDKLRGDEIIRRLSRMLWVLAGMTVLLILANLGTAWAVAVMAKDTTVDTASGELRVKDHARGKAMVTTRGTGDVFLFVNMNATARSAFIDEEDEAEENTDVDGEDEDAPGDDSLFCITPENAARIWHDATTGTATTALFDFTSPIDYEQAASSESQPFTTADAAPLDLNSLTLRADGAVINETHACLGTGLPTSRLGVPQLPSFFCIELVSSVCADMVEQDTDSSTAAGTVSPEISNSFGRSEEEEDGGDRRRLFHVALEHLHANSPNVDSSHRQGQYEGIGSRGSSNHLLRGLVPAPERTQGRYAKCVQACDNKGMGRKCKKRCRRERKYRRKTKKKVFQAEVPIENTLSVYLAPGSDGDHLFSSGNSEPRFNLEDWTQGPDAAPDARRPVAAWDR
mmetsp:Transcript_25555/g.55865  ORF Transcript_25555/g.55865 Transcript_25555/m.55865 type:complete len:526 (-) Transcript_25555:126-1703(-)